MAKTMLLFSLLLSLASGARAENYPADMFLDADHVLVGDEIVAVSAAPTEASADSTTEAGFVQADVQKWPGGLVPVVFSSKGGAIAPEQEKMFFAACAQWTRRAAVKCQRRKDEPVYLTVYRGGNCSAHVGWAPDPAALVMSLGERCWVPGIIIHEMGHVLGARHEQARPDRDKYITVHWDNIRKQNSFNYAFKKVPMVTTTPYDFGSIMHYGPKGFSINGKDTFTLNKGYEKNAARVGQRLRVSELDGQNMAAFYGKPAGANLTLASADDEDGAADADAFVGEDPITEASSLEEAARTYAAVVPKRAKVTAKTAGPPDDGGAAPGKSDMKEHEDLEKEAAAAVARERAKREAEAKAKGKR